jgi:hypothetical protein
MKQFFLSISLLLSACLLFGQKHYIATMGATNTLDDIKRVRTTADGGSIVLGYTESSPDGDITLIKLNDKGTITWSKKIGTVNLDAPEGAVQTVDGGYVVVGETYSSNLANDGILIVKVDATGNTLWSKTMGGTTRSEPKNVIATADSGVIMVGFTDDWARKSTDAALDIKLDKSGNIVWQHVVEGSRNQQHTAVDRTADGGYVVAGQAFAIPSSTSLDATLVKYNGAGVYQWSHKYPVAGAEIIYGVKSTPDGGSVIVGVGKSTQAGFLSDVLLYKMNATGVVQWAKSYGTRQYEKPWDVTIGADSSYYIATQINIGDTNRIKNVPGILNIAPNGTLRWCKLYGDTSKNGIPYAVDRDAHGILLAASTQAYGDSLLDHMVVHTAWDGSVSTKCVPILWPLITGSFTVGDTILYNDSVGAVTTAVTVSNTALGWSSVIRCTTDTVTALSSLEILDRISLYPIPTHHQLYLVHHGTTPIGVRIYSILGAEVLPKIEITEANQQIDVSSLQVGIYLVHITQGDQQKTVKMIIE